MADGLILKLEKKSITRNYSKKKQELLGDKNDSKLGAIGAQHIILYGLS